MKSRQAAVFGTLSLVVALQGCGRESAAPGPDPNVVIARSLVGEIRRGDIQQAIDNNLASAPQPITAETRHQIVRKIVERRVRTEMLLAEALEKGYAERPEVKFRQAVAVDQVLADDLLASLTADVHAADGVVAAEVDRRHKETNSAETRKFSHIYLRAAETDLEARREAVALMASLEKQIQAGADFNQLAERHSTSVMARGGGRIDWTTRQPLMPAAGDLVFALESEGEVSPILATADGLNLFRLDGIRRGPALDVEAIRAATRRDLDTEARQAAIQGRRQQELDAHGVEWAPGERLAGWDRLNADDPTRLARWQGAAGAGEVKAAELLAVRGRLWAKQPPAAELRRLVENRLLAAARRTQGFSPELDQRLAEAKRQVVIDSYRGDLMQALDTPSSDGEVARYLRENSSALALRDFQIDLLFFPQVGKEVAPVYAAGEQIGARLRQGEAFDDLLARPGHDGAQICRDARGLDLETIGKSSPRLRRALLNLGEGEVSTALYFERPLPLSATCNLESAGLAFVRLRKVGTLTVEQARPQILAALSKEKVDRGVAEIQARLIAASGLEILVPEG